MRRPSQLTSVFCQYTEPRRHRPSPTPSFNHSRSTNKRTGMTANINITSPPEPDGCLHSLHPRQPLTTDSWYTAWVPINAPLSATFKVEKVTRMAACRGATTTIKGCNRGRDFRTHQLPVSVLKSASTGLAAVLERRSISGGGGGAACFAFW